MKKKAARRSAKSLTAMDVLLQRSGQPQSRVSALTEQFGSVMSLARADVAQLMKRTPGLHITEARDLHARAQAMSVVIARQFREQRLTASVRQANRPPTGIKGLVDGPTYTDMFNPDWANQCPPDAIEATTSPVAYLADLYRYAKDLEATGNPAEVITLDTRRPDLKDLVLDHTALNRVEPTIVLVNEILEKSIRSHLDGISLQDTSVDDALLKARYPNALPFERYTSQINYVLARKNRSLGDTVRAADPDYPYFKEPGVHSLLSDIALIQDTGLGPVQQGLLLEALYFPEAEDDTHSLGGDGWRIDPRSRLLTRADDGDETPSTFFEDNFGVGNFIELEDTQTFCLRTGLNTEELESLLSVGAFAPTRSPNVPGDVEVEGNLAGSVYINAGQAPAMGIETLPAEYAEEVLLQGPRHRITHISPERFDRMNRMIRLARWLDLTFDQVDQLLVASMQAELHASDSVRRMTVATANPFLITQNTLRSLGLFQILRTQFKVSAEDFAALLYGLGEFGRGKTASQFDRVFNAQAMFSIPLILDDAPFTALPQNEAERQKIDHLCAALGMTFEVYRFVAKVVEQTYAGESLRWSREVVSAFYRLVRLPRYIGLTTVEALALLELLDGGGSHLVSKLAGVTRIATHYASSNTDTLSVIHTLVDCSLWLKDNDWTVAQLCQLVLPALTQPVATDAELGLLQQMHERLVSALITESSFAQVGAPDVAVTIEEDAEGKQVYASEPIDWFAKLCSFVESVGGAKGLVKYLIDETEESFEASLGTEVRLVLETYGLPVEELHPKITNMIMRARGAQEALLMEGLAGYLNTSADLAKVLLFWSKGNRYQLLMEVLRVFGNASRADVAIGDEVLLVLQSLSKRAAIATHLGLSPAFISALTEHPDRFGLANAGLSLQLVYFVTRYASILQLSEQTEDTLLNYFQLIDTVWEGASEGDRRLIRDSAASKLAGFLKWGVREVLAVAFYLNAEGVVFTLKDLDTLTRVCLLSRHTGLDANALLALHELTPTTSTDAYRQAAELALSCLTETLPGEAVGEVGQSLPYFMTVTPDYLVANREDDIATYTITLRDFTDTPITNVAIRWTTDLGELQQPETTTNEDGQSSNTLASGAKMGVANVWARFGLGEELKAPAVTIDCDEASVHFLPGERAPDQALSNKLESIHFTVEAVDDYGNKAVDRAIEWGATLGEFERYQTYTDVSGMASAELRSRSAGTSEVVAQYSNGQRFEYGPVEFVSIPYFQYVRFRDVVTVGVEVFVDCCLVELDGTPKAGVDVDWTADVGEWVDAKSTTGTDGVASAKFMSMDRGAVVVTASGGEPVKPKSSQTTTIYPMTVIERYESAGDRYVVGSPQPFVCSVWLMADTDIAVGRSVEWLIDGEPITSSRSDKDGMASFSHRSFELGPHIVTAKVSGTENTHDFSVEATSSNSFDRVLSHNGVPLDLEASDLLCRGADYELRVTVRDEDGEPVEGVQFALEAVGQNPLLFGVRIDALGDTRTSTLDGVVYQVKIVSSHEFREVHADLNLLLGSREVSTATFNYRVGWVYELSLAQKYQSSIYFEFKSIHGGESLGPFFPNSAPKVTIAVPSRDAEETERVTVTGIGSLGLNLHGEVEQQTLLGDDIFVKEEVVEEEGYWKIVVSSVICK
jgi:hypothetical protein